MQDIVVKSVLQTKLKNRFMAKKQIKEKAIDHGIKTEEFVGEYSAEATKEIGVTNHEVSALTFFLRIIEWMTANY